jgi:hypothetical protein
MVRRVARSILLIIPLLFLACSDTPKSTVEKMKEKACDRDIQGFFSYIDKSEVAQNIKKEVLSAPEYKGLGEAILESAMPFMQSQLWQGYEDEIKKGKDGSICNIRLLAEKTKENQVLIQFPNGRQQNWGFTKYGDRWLLTSLSLSGDIPINSNR